MADAPESAGLSPPAVTRPSGLEVAVAVLICAAICAALALAMGRDLNWDYFNYHGYAAFSTLDDRAGQDYFPAGYQGYLNPLPFLPFALMQSAGWPSAAIGATLAAIQSLNFLFLYLISRRLFAAGQYPLASAVIATALGSLSLVVASQLGSTFVDPTTTPPVMAGLWLLLQARTSWRPLAAGVLVGGAVALKLTNAPFALGLLGAIWWWQRAAWRSRVATVALCGTGLALGFLALYGHWGLRLAQEFGSPVFPLFNSILKAEDFPAISPSFHRFIPQSIGQLLALPLAMVEHKSWIYTEVTAPDLRPLALIALLVLWGAKVTITARSGAPMRLAQAGTGGVDRAGSRRVPFLAAFGTISAAAWLATSANGRYATPLLLLLGPALLWLAQKVFDDRRALGVLSVLGVLQFVHLAHAGNPRWNPHPWAAEWLPVRVPPALAQAPQLFVTVGKSSESYLAAYVHRDSVFVNPVGLISLPDRGPGSQRFERLRSAHAGRTWVVFPVPSRASAVRVASMKSAVDVALDRLRLRLGDAECQAILVNDAPAVWPSSPRAVADDEIRHLLACPALQLPPGPTPHQAMRERLTAIMDAFERKCPSLFSPAQVPVEGGGRYWTRFYGKHDLDLTADVEAGLLLYGLERQPVPIAIARLDRWQQDLDRFDCALPYGGARDVSTLAPHARP